MKPYGSLELTVASPPQTFREPFTVDEVLAYLRQDPDSDEISLIESMISAARETAEIFQNRDLVVKQYDLSLDTFGARAFGFTWDNTIELRGPLRSVDLVRFRDSAGSTTDLTEDTDYIVDTARSLIAPAYGKCWPFFTPHPSSAVLIRFTSGYASTHPFWKNAGQRVKQGMKMLITAWYEERVPFISAVGEISEFPFAVTALLSYGAQPRV